MKVIIYIPLLLNSSIVNMPEIFQIYKVIALNIIGNVSKSGVANKGLYSPFCTWCNISLREKGGVAIVSNKDLIKIFLLYISKFGIHLQFW
jgi:hypothetical protein